MQTRSFILSILILIALIVYLFVSAPPLLPEASASAAQIPIAEAFTILNSENSSVRTLWTKEIVGAGKKAGLNFSEDWREQDIDAGPLPALFLRETALSLEKNPVQLSLFLGSDYPINRVNRFTGQQSEMFEQIKVTGEPLFFYDSELQMSTAMFADIATVQTCVDCHNDHAQSPKQDWQLNDVMGATTWLYPASSVSEAELLAMIRALRLGFSDVYTDYIDKARHFATPPAIGEQWPATGYYLPSLDVFTKEIQQRTSSATLHALLNSREAPYVTHSN